VYVGFNNHVGAELALVGSPGFSTGQVDKAAFTGLAPVPGSLEQPATVNHEASAAAVQHSTPAFTSSSCHIAVASCANVPRLGWSLRPAVCVCGCNVSTRPMAACTEGASRS